jgi:hypothetical protein
MRQWERGREPWGDTVTVEPVSIIDAGDRVVARQVVHGVGRGPTLHVEFTAVCTLRNGRIFYFEFFWDHAEALKAVGLSESAPVPDPGSRTGLASMTEGYRGWLSAWEEFRVAPEEYREIDDERVLVLTRWGGRGKTSGLDLGQMRTRGAHLFYVRAEKVRRFVVYFDRERALADLGLKE